MVRAMFEIFIFSCRRYGEVKVIEVNKKQYLSILQLIKKETNKNGGIK